MLCLGFFSSCEKNNWDDFVKSTGKIVLVSRVVTDSFATISLKDNLDLEITQGNQFSIAIEGGENLIPEIETSISGHVLTIANHNKFNWVRSYDVPLKVKVGLPHLIYLKYESTGTVTTRDTLREDSIFITCLGGSGFIKPCLYVINGHFSNNKGSADFEMTGHVGVNYVYSNSYGRFYCPGLESVYLFINHYGTNDCTFHVLHELGYTLKGPGNLYYSGKPDWVNGTATGQGKAIALDP